MSNLSHRTCTFNVFGKTRRLTKTLEQIVTSVNKFIQPGADLSGYSLYNEADLWGDVCKDLEVANTTVNRLKIHKATASVWKETSVIKTSTRDTDNIEETACEEHENSLGGSDGVDSSWSPLQQKDEELSPSCDNELLVTRPDSDAENEKCSKTPPKLPEDKTEDVIKKQVSWENVAEVLKDESPEKESTSSSEKESGMAELTSCTSSEAEDEFFTCCLPQEPCFFFIDKREWQELRKHQRGRSFHGLQWTNIIAKGIRTIHPFCSFGFKRHSVRTITSSKNTPLFKCTGYCRFQDCPVIVNVEVKDEVSLKAVVEFTGDVCHSTTELKRRPVRADARESIGEILETKLPRSVYLDSIEKLPEMVMQSGCRDEAPTKEVLKNIAWTQRQLKRPHPNELLSLQQLIDQKLGSDNEVLQKVIMHPKGVMLWSKRTLAIFYRRCKEDIVYLDATGSIIQKGTSTSPPYYVYELVVRNPSKGASPLPVATYLTCDHTTASVTYFLQAFQTDMTKMYGKKAIKRPIMIICDGSLVLLNSISFTFCKLSLEDLLKKYYDIISGKYQEDMIDIPIIHRCLSHIMKNAKDLCKKHVPKQYKVAMHTFGLLACSSSLKQMDEVLLSATVLFSSPCSGDNVAKHYSNLQVLMQQVEKLEVEGEHIVAEDYKNDVGTTPLENHFKEVIEQAPLDFEGEENQYHAPKFIPNLTKYFLPHATLWSGLMLGDIGRHGASAAYQDFSKKYNKISQSKKQNFTQDNRTQGIMEKSQWDLKKIRFNRRRLTRLDDFVQIYQKKHDALLREYEDNEKLRKRSHRVEMEQWKKKTKTRKGIYVSPLAKGLPFKNVKSKAPPKKHHKKPEGVTQSQETSVIKTSTRDTDNIEETACEEHENSLGGSDGVDSSWSPLQQKDEELSPSCENELLVTRPDSDAENEKCSKTPPKLPEDKTEDVIKKQAASSAEKSAKKDTEQKHVMGKKTERTKEKRKKAPVKMIRRRLSKIEGPIWNNSNPSEPSDPQRLSRPTKIQTVEQILHQDYWLTSDVIDMASYLMAVDNEHIDGFQSVLPFSALSHGGIVGTPKKKFVQILNIRQSHWITVSNVFCDEKQLAVYDSKRSTLDPKTLQALSWLIRPQSGNFVVLQPSVQQQSNHSNCGPFAIAFAYAVCQSHPPEQCLFNESRLRAQLYTSLAKKSIAFGIQSVAEANLSTVSTVVPVYCVCRTAHYRELMVQCSKCQEWYHPTCVEIPRRVIGNNRDWQCFKCQ